MLKSRINKITINISYITRLSGQYNCWSLKWSWSIACRQYSNYIFILDLTPCFIGLDKDNCKARRKSVMTNMCKINLSFKIDGNWVVLNAINIMICAILFVNDV